MTSIAPIHGRPAVTDFAQLTGPRAHAAAVVVFALIVSLLVVPIAALALALAIGLLPLPFELFRVLQRLPIVFPLHMGASGLALIVIPIAAFTRHHQKVHRAAGRLAAVAITVGGVTALLVALASEASGVARAGFFVQGIVWLALLAAAVAAIRRGAVARHAALMLAVAAVASGAIWIRLVVAAVIALDVPFAPAYAIAAWACWLVPLAIAGKIGISGAMGLKLESYPPTPRLRRDPLPQGRG
jgi:hypothetical protein